MYQREPLANELVSRQQMWASPPHILLTNYAMLEYLLLRPRDNVFFDGDFAINWRFLVIDEAHTYTGAKGIEMAMLLRRLKDRVVDFILKRKNDTFTKIALMKFLVGVAESDIDHVLSVLISEDSLYQWYQDKYECFRMKKKFFELYGGGVR